MMLMVLSHFMMSTLWDGRKNEARETTYTLEPSGDCLLS